MRPEDVASELVEKAAREIGRLPNATHLNSRQAAKVALAAVLPEIQAQALRDAADAARSLGIMAGSRIDVGERASLWLHGRAFAVENPLTATTEEPTDV